jgi:hypothetical protein
MNRSRLPKPTRLIAGLPTSLLLAILTVPLVAQRATEAPTQAPTSLGYDKAHEITFYGTIEEVVSKHEAGAPAGMHLLVAGSHGVTDAHVGPFLEKDVKEALHTGTPVQIIGAMNEINGKNYLLARQLILGGRIVTVRSANGFLVRFHGSRISGSNRESTTEKIPTVELNGGAR